MYSREQKARAGARYFGQPLTDYDVRVHARLNERMLMVSHQRHGLFTKLRGLLFDNPLVRRRRL